MNCVFDYNLFPDVLLETYVEFNGEDFLYFPEGIEFYTLFRGGKKINSFQELMYIAEVLLWLNPEIEWERFLEMMTWVSDRTNRRSVRTYSEVKIKNESSNVFSRLRRPYLGRLRKIIFNPSRIIPKEEKMSIIGRVCGRGKVSDENLYDVIEEMMLSDVKITINCIAHNMGVSRQTVSRHITEEMKDVISYHNKGL